MDVGVLVVSTGIVARKLQLQTVARAPAIASDFLCARVLARGPRMSACVYSVTPEQRVVRLQREPKARKRDNKHIAWVAEDKLGRLLLVAGKLAFLEQAINAHATAPYDRVTVCGLYEAACHCKGDRTGRFFKGRWRLSYVPLDEVAETVDRMRGGFEQVAVLASPGHAMVA